MIIPADNEVCRSLRRMEMVSSPRFLHSPTSMKTLSLTQLVPINNIGWNDIFLGQWRTQIQPQIVRLPTEMRVCFFHDPVSTTWLERIPVDGNEQGQTFAPLCTFVHRNTRGLRSRVAWPARMLQCDGLMSWPTQRVEAYMCIKEFRIRMPVSKGPRVYMHVE